MFASLLMVGAVLLFRSQATSISAPVELTASVALGAASYVATLVAGDLLRIWPNYVRGGIQTIREAMRARQKANPSSM